MLLYIDTTDFYILILFPATLHNSLMSSSSFLVVSLRLSVFAVMSSAYSDSFTSFFPFQIYFISCLIVVAMIFHFYIFSCRRSSLLVFRSFLSIVAL